MCWAHLPSIPFLEPSGDPAPYAIRLFFQILPGEMPPLYVTALAPAAQDSKCCLLIWLVLCMCLARGFPHLFIAPPYAAAVGSCPWETGQPILPVPSGTAGDQVPQAEDSGLWEPGNAASSEWSGFLSGSAPGCMRRDAWFPSLPPITNNSL